MKKWRPRRLKWLDQSHKTGLSPGSFFCTGSLCTLWPHQQKLPLRVWESHTMSLYVPQKPPLAFFVLLCVQEAGTPSFCPLVFSWCQGEAGVFILHIPSGQVMVLSVALLLGNGHGSSHVASLHGCDPYWVPVTGMFSSTPSLWPAKAPTSTSPGMALPAISSSCPLFCMQSLYQSRFR